MLKVNEIFGPVQQGEGKSIGKEVMFLRLAFCNLHCIWCDTPYTWNWVNTKFKHPKKFEISKEVHLMDFGEVIFNLIGLKKQVKSLVISGGEPLLQQVRLIPLLEVLKSVGWWIEIETNGSVLPLDKIFNLVDQFNCSPKLANSGNSKKKRIKPEILATLAQNPKSTFKFVVSRERDISEITAMIECFNMKQVYLMPLGMTVNELKQTREMTKRLCVQYNLNFSDRFHIVKYGGQRGV